MANNTEGLEIISLKSDGIEDFLTRISKGKLPEDERQIIIGGQVGLDNVRALERRLFDWRDYPLNSDILGEDLLDPVEEKTLTDALCVDAACCKLCDLPSMKGLVFDENQHDIENIGIFGSVTNDDNYSGYADSTKIVINPSYETSSIALTIAHELNHRRQDQKNIHQQLDLRNNIFMQRIYEADSVAFQVSVAWEASKRGEVDLWDASTRSHPLETRAFEETALKDPDSVRDGRAAQTAFKAFFEDVQRLEYYDRYGCQRFRHNHTQLDEASQGDVIRSAASHLNGMPFYDEQAGQVVKRENYLNSSFVEELVTKPSYRTIQVPEVEQEVCFREEGGNNTPSFE